MTIPHPAASPSLGSGVTATAATWRPIAGGALADSLSVALAGIADSLAEPRAAWLPAGAPPAEQRAADLSLASGAAGQAVLHAYLDRAGRDAAAARAANDPAASERAARDSAASDRAARCLVRATEGVSQVEMSASLFSGFTGVAWAVEHLVSPAPDGESDALAEVDDALCAHLTRGGPDHYDLVSGLVGLGAYALERRPRPRADELFGLVIARLAERAEPMDGGLAWRTPPDVFAASRFALGPFDLGLAHGVAGVIALLAAACLQGVEIERARALLAGAIGWLHAQRLPASATTSYSNSAGPGATHAASRLAWCYGDLGIACALDLAGRAADERAWRDEALALALRAGARDPHEARVCDAPFCHGAAGVAHLLNRLHHASGEERLADLARLWLARALEWREPGAGFGGFRSWAPLESPTGSWVDDPGLLSGAAGIGLVFTAALGSVEPEWDRLFLLSARRRDA